jgi:hypothetical protein
MILSRRRHYLRSTAWVGPGQTAKCLREALTMWQSGSLARIPLFPLDLRPGNQWAVGVVQKGQLQGSNSVGMSV